MLAVLPRMSPDICWWQVSTVVMKGLSDGTGLPHSLQTMCVWGFAGHGEEAEALLAGEEGKCMSSLEKSIRH